MEEARRRAYLDVLGVPVWRVRSSAPKELTETESLASEAGAELVGEPATASQWQALQAQVAGCESCALHTSRTQTVFGVGNQSADWLVIGEAPGAEEDRLGEPFVGRAGKLLDNMLFAIGLDRNKAYIANVLKCRPPQNRDPLPDEVASCADFLRRQIELIQPKVILAVGRIAAQNLLKTEDTLSRLRGRVHAYPGTRIPVVVTYHPAYLLRSPGEKRRAWDDLKFALAVYRGQTD